MHELQREKSELETRLATPLPPQEIGTIGSAMHELDEELAAHEEEWLALSEEIETIERALRREDSI